MISNQLSVIRIFVERGESLSLLPVPLKLVITLLFFFLNVGECAFSMTVHAAVNSLSSSNKKSQRFISSPSNNSPKIGSSFKLAFFDRHAEGWHWYEEVPRDNKIEERKKSSFKENSLKESPSGRSSSSSSPTPTEKIEAQRKELETKLHSAILEPSHENIITYILAQKVLMDQSQRFSESWKQVVMKTPALDETLIHPVDQNARHVYYQERHQDITKRIKALAQEYGLFFFFKGACSYCHHFAPIVKDFAKKHGWSVLAVSLDEGTLPEFPGAKKDNGMAARLQVSHVPALIAFHPTSGQMIPLAYGMVSESEIEERVDVLTRSLSSRVTRDKATHDGVKK